MKTKIITLTILQVALIMFSIICLCCIFSQIAIAAGIVNLIIAIINFIIVTNIKRDIKRWLK